MNWQIKRLFSTSRIIILGFAMVIGIGTLLLLLPVSVKNGGSVSLLDALFTATSAVCVTGLVVHDTASAWSSFGQAVILGLIQIGGLGVVTVVAGISLLSRKKVGLIQRSTLQDAISAHQMGGVVKLVMFILKITLFFELSGAVLLSLAFVPRFGVLRGFWYGCFHSISAFCNAGFDLMGTEEAYSSLTHFSADPLVNAVIMCLIVAGGLGFLSWEDITRHRHHIRKYRMQTKVILVVSFLLISLPAVCFWAGELQELPAGERALSALFQSVTTRTAGFNTADLTKFSEAGLVLMIILMVIGGSPGSTAGGMKTTTAAVLCSSVMAVFHKQKSGVLFRRRISSDTVHNAAAILNMYLVLFVTSAMVISRLEGLPFLTCLFETASAIGTVGLTLGITASLGNISKLILIALMYFGRVGALTLVFAAFVRKTDNNRMPEEKITVG